MEMWNCMNVGMRKWNVKWYSLIQQNIDDGMFYLLPPGVFFLIRAEFF